MVASGNAGKLAELGALLAPLQVEVAAQARFGVGAADEPHPSFVENALAKARHAARATGWPALADDSGLCCAALAGAPGVHSARYAGESAHDSQNNALLIEQLAGHADRSAHYVCVLVALRAADDPEPLIAEARWHGSIVDQARGTNGFGYDPHFWLREFGCTAAELDSSTKNRISHRGQAMTALLAALRGRWQWLG